MLERKFGYNEVLLEDQRVDINKAIENGWTPLYIICERGDFEALQYLLVSGRELNLNEGNKNNVIDIARTRGHSKVIELLESFQNGSKFNKI